MENDVRLINAKDIVWRLGCNDDGRTFAYVRATDIDALPTIDPESLRPVARWANVKTMGGADCVQCSGCGYREYDHVKYTRFDYCPGCGARMKGANDG